MPTVVLGCIKVQIKISCSFPFFLLLPHFSFFLIVKDRFSDPAWIRVRIGFRTNQRFGDAAYLSEKNRRENKTNETKKKNKIK